MKNRRDFIKTAAFAVAGGLAVPGLLSACGGEVKKAKTNKNIGLQLYSLRDDVKDLGIKAVLEAVAKMGYVNLETAGYSDGKIYNLEPAEFKKMVDDLGMKASSAHLGRNLSENKTEDMAWWSRAIDAHNTAGFKYMVMPYAPIGGEGASPDTVKQYGDYFNEIALAVAGASMSFGYHNHDFEFKTKIEDRTLYDYLMEYTSPSHVFFQLDVYWAQVGGYSPAEVMKQYADRIKTLHIKDEKAIGASGTMDFKAVFDQAYSMGVKDWYVEVERYDGTPQEDVQKSFDFLNAAEYVK
ncbi:MAG: TIM barrel protein [Prevotellaceae bacterium]|jgi:sugar phosphate isomerase/epimerase|nr:TIM barrel protein [Prevotellaceae bacterium]